MTIRFIPYSGPRHTAYLDCYHLAWGVYQGEGDKGFLGYVHAYRLTTEPPRWAIVICPPGGYLQQEIYDLCREAGVTPPWLEKLG